jgi:hypothetical protein
MPYPYGRRFVGATDQDFVVIRFVGASQDFAAIRGRQPGFHGDSWAPPTGIRSDSDDVGKDSRRVQRRLSIFVGLLALEAVGGLKEDFRSGSSEAGSGVRQRLRSTSR